MWGLVDQIKQYRKERKELAQFLLRLQDGIDLDLTGGYLPKKLQEWVDRLNRD